MQDLMHSFLSKINACRCSLIAHAIAAGLSSVLAFVLGLRDDRQPGAQASQTQKELGRKILVFFP